MKLQYLQGEGPDLQAADGGADLIRVSHCDNAGFEHLVDEKEPVRQLCGRLVEIGRAHQLWAVMALLAQQTDHVNCRRHAR